MNTSIEGLCELCGDPARTSIAYRCELCDGLLERIRYERGEAESATKRRLAHLSKADTLRGWQRLEQLALAAAEQSMADVHEYRLRQARDPLTARELAYIARLEAAAEAA